MWTGSLLKFRVGSFYTNSSWDAAFWSSMPQRIRAAYILINNAHANPLQKVTEEDIETMRNECRFLTAYYYWTMTEAYGSVPYFGDIIDVNAPLEDMTVGQMAFDDMVDMLDKQLLDLSNKLPAKWEEAFFGRATSIACLAVRARMLLFARPDCKYGDWEGHCTPRGCGGNGGYGLTQGLVDAFFMKNGLSPIQGYNSDGSPIINEASGYKEKGFSTEPEIRETAWDPCRRFPNVKKGQITTPNTFNMYSNREPRFYLTVLYNGAWFHQEGRAAEMMFNQSDGGPTHDAPQNGYLNRKKISLESIPRDGKRPYRPGILYRLGEAYLNYAEALNECEPGNTEIISYVNKIRERAGIPEYGTGTDNNGFQRIPYTNNQETVRELIRKERRVELCGEGIRYHDIRRWKLGEKLLNGYEYGMNFNGTEYSDDASNSKAFFVRTKSLLRVYQKKQYWMPIYQDQMDKDPTLVQAPFWNTNE